MTIGDVDNDGDYDLLVGLDYTPIGDKLRFYNREGSNSLSIENQNSKIGVNDLWQIIRDEFQKEYNSSLRQFHKLESYKTNEIPQ